MLKYMSFMSIHILSPIPNSKNSLNEIPSVQTVMGFIDIKKAAEHLDTTLKHAINYSKNNERCFIATHTLLKPKLHFGIETFMSCKIVKFIQ